MALLFAVLWDSFMIYTEAFPIKRRRPCSAQACFWPSISAARNQAFTHDLGTHPFRSARSVLYFLIVLVWRWVFNKVQAKLDDPNPRSPR